MTLSASNLPTLLRQLHDALVLEDAAPIDWIVCGGSALSLQALTGRTTQDVDVLAHWRADTLEAVAPGSFAAPVARAIDRVAEAHATLRRRDGSGRRWVNLGPQEIARQGLPEGFAGRLVTFRIGERLTLHLLGRLDLIALKLYAASDDLGDRQQVHIGDLVRLAPTAAELAFALEWVLTRPDPEHRIRPSLKRLLQELGHDDLAYYV
jgi:hypothetical protein